MYTWIVIDNVFLFGTCDTVPPQAVILEKNKYENQRTAIETFISKLN